MKKSSIPVARMLLFAAMAISFSAKANDKDSIAAKYSNENAVITNYTEHLVIREESGKLVAKSSVTEERMLLSDAAPGMYNHDYVYHGYFNKLLSLDAAVSIPSATGYKKVPTYDFHNIHSDRDNVFYDDSRETVISFSGLVKNALTETKYSIEYTDLNMITPFYFQEGIPISRASFEVTVPKYVDIRFVTKGLHNDWIKETKEETTNNITYKFTATDIPVMKDYEDVPSFSHYAPHIVPIIRSYTLPGADNPVNLLSDMNHLYSYMYKYIRNLNVDKDELLDKTVAEITEKDTGQLQKAADIYSWVQKNMHYIAFEDGLEGFVPRQAALVCNRKYGDCKDMTSILVAMCRQAGLDAHFTWIGTREKPYTWEETPVPFVANHMICALKWNGGWIFMDGTHPRIPFGKYPESIQGKEALIAIDANNYKIVTVPISSADDNVTIDTTYLHLKDKSISGTVKLHYHGAKAWDIGTMMMYYKNEEREKEIRSICSRGSNKYLQTKYNYEASDTGAKDVAITSDFTIDDYVQKAGKQYYVNMNLSQRYEDIDVSESRVVPYYFRYKHTIKEITVLELPKGYKLSYLPKTAQGSADSLWSYKITYKTEAGKVILTKEYKVNTLKEIPAQFPATNKMADTLKELYKETVVLTAN